MNYKIGDLVETPDGVRRVTRVISAQLECDFNRHYDSENVMPVSLICNNCRDRIDDMSACKFVYDAGIWLCVDCK